MRKTKKKTWTKKMAEVWKNYQPPIRPSAQTLKVIEGYLNQKIKQKGQETKVLILGSTPEFRDLVLKKNLIPTVVDYSEDNNRALGSLKKVKKGQEIFVKQDWRKLKLDEKFDLVLAEASLTVLAKKDVPGFLKRVKDLLALDGYFLAKTWIRPSPKKQDLQQILRDYRKNYANRIFYTVAMGPLYSYFYNQKKNSIALKDFQAKLEKLYQQGILRQKEIQSTRCLGYKDLPLKLYIPLKSEIIKLMEKHFKIQAIKPSGFCNSKYFPVFVLRPKK